MRAQIKASNVPETVWNFCGDRIILSNFIAITVGDPFLFGHPVVSCYVMKNTVNRRWRPPKEVEKITSSCNSMEGLRERAATTPNRKWHKITIG